MAKNDDLIRLKRAFAKAEPRLAASFMSMVTAMRATIPLKDLEDLIARGLYGEALNTVLARTSMISTAYTKEFVTAAEDVAAQLGRKFKSIVVDFNQTNERAVLAMRENQLRLVQGFSQQQTAATQRALIDGIQKGVNPREMARRFRESIGLTPRQVRAVQNYRKALELLDPRALQRALRDRRFDRSFERAIRDGKSLPQAQINKMVGRYHQRYIKYRAEVIGRTEGLRSVHQGGRALFDQAFDEGKLDKQDVTREWQSAGDDGRTRDWHLDMHGQKRGHDEAFTSGKGNQLMYPGDPAAPAEDTVQCRCTVGTRISSQIEA